MKERSSGKQTCITYKTKKQGGQNYDANHENKQLDSRSV